MKVTIETREEGVSWKLQTLPEGEVLTSSLIFHPTIEECLADLRRHAKSWRNYLPGTTVETVGEVRVFGGGVKAFRPTC